VTLPLVHVDGQPYDQGRQHGLALGDQIAHNLAVYYDRFLTEGQLEAGEARRRAATYLPLLEGSPFFDTIRGVADGAQHDLLDIVVLNLRYELLYYQYGVCGIGQPDGCTALAIEPPQSANGHLLLGQNWDWIPEVSGAVLHTTEVDGLETLGFTEAGIVGSKIGLNSAGLGLTINGLMTTVDDWSQVALPFHARCYAILRSRTLDQAVAVVVEEQRPCSANFLLAQPSAGALDLEAAPTLVNTITPDRGMLVHANHFVDPVSLGVEEPVTEKRPHTYLRHDRLRVLLEARTPVSLGDLEVVLRDHDNYPDSICRHENREDGPEEWCITVTSALMDLDERSLRLTDGPPCEHLYQGYSLAHTALLGR
jgi:isopenicillin-N N-acyltransferase-like protein